MNTVDGVPDRGTARSGIRDRLPFVPRIQSGTGDIPGIGTATAGLPADSYRSVCRGPLASGLIQPEPRALTSAKGRISRGQVLVERDAGRGLYFAVAAASSNAATIVWSQNTVNQSTDMVELARDPTIRTCASWRACVPGSLLRQIRVLLASGRSRTQRARRRRLCLRSPARPPASEGPVDEDPAPPPEIELTERPPTDGTALDNRLAGHDGSARRSRSFPGLQPAIRIARLWSGYHRRWNCAWNRRGQKENDRTTPDHGPG